MATTAKTTTARPTRAALYARQSVGGEVDSLSIDVQLETCRKLAQKNGYEVISEYTDHNRASWTYPKHPAAMPYFKLDTAVQADLNVSTKTEREYFRNGLGELFENIKNIDVIVCTNSDRLRRALPNSMLDIFFKNYLNVNKVFVLSESEGKIDFNDSGVDLIQTITNAIKIADLKQKKEKSKQSIFKLKLAGYPSLPKLTGYTIKDKKATPNQFYDLIKTAFDMFYAGKSKREIIVYLNQNGLKVRAINWLDNILQNPLYAGKFKFNNEYMVAKYFDSPMLDFNYWKEIQQKFNGYTKTVANKKKDYLHSGLCFCGYCGGKIKLMGYGDKGILKCREWADAKRGTDDCKGLAVPLEDNRTGEQLNSLLRPFATYAYINNSENEKQNAEIDKQIAVLNFDINEKEKSLRLIEDKTKKDTSNSTAIIAYLGIIESIGNEITNIKNNIKTLEGRKTKKAEINLLDFSEMNKLSNAELNKLIKVSVKRMLLYKDKIVIEMTNGKTTEVMRVVKMKNSQSVYSYIESTYDARLRIPQSVF